MKKAYEHPEVLIACLQVADVLTMSGNDTFDISTDYDNRIWE